MNGYFSKIISRNLPAPINTGLSKGPAKKEVIQAPEDFSQTNTGLMPEINVTKDMAVNPVESSPDVQADTGFVKKSDPLKDFSPLETQTRNLPLGPNPILNEISNRPQETQPEKKPIATPNQSILPTVVATDNEKKPENPEIISTIVNNLRLSPENKTYHITNQNKETVTNLIQDNMTVVAPGVKKNPTPLPLANIHQSMHALPLHAEKKQGGPKLVIGKIIVEIIKPSNATVKTTRQKNYRHAAPSIPKSNINAGSKLSFGLGQL
jgi:hypothetical protein